MLGRLKLLLPAGFLALSVVLRVYDPVILQEFRLRIFDNYQRLSPRQYTPMPVLVIDVDDETLARYGQWPWPRTMMAQLVARLINGGAASIALDVLFAEPDRLSLENLLDSVAEPKARQALAEALTSVGVVENDAVLADTLARGPTVGGFIPNDKKGSRRPALKAGLAHSGDDPLPFLRHFPGAPPNLPKIEEAYHGLGSLSPIFDSDGVIRRVPLFVAVAGKIYPSIATEALRVAQGASTLIIKSSGASGETAFGEQTGVNHVKIGQFIVPTDGEAAMWLRDTGPVNERRIPAWQILDGTAPAERLEGAILFIGTSAAGLKDQHSTPLSQATTGVTLHVQMIEQILLQDFLERPDWADGAEILFLLLLGLFILALFTIRRIGATQATLISGLLILGAISGSGVAYGEFQLLLDPVYPVFVGILVYSGASFLRFLDTERERRRVRRAFSQYMAPALVNQLAENPGQLRLGGEMRDLTLLFCDIRGFTTISERLDAQELTELINRFLTPMTHIIMESKGTIDKYMGDCIMAFWNAPISVPEHRRRAVESALEMRHRLVALNAELALETTNKNQDPIQLGIGIGLHSGICCVGNVGSDQRFDYSALGDTVNLAARLEGQCKTYGVEVLLSEASLEGLDDYLAFLELDLIQVKGKTEPIRVFTVLGDAGVLITPEFTALKACHDR